MSLTTTQKWRRTIAWLRRNFPARYPATIRSWRRKKDFGETSFQEGRFYIWINRKKAFDARIDALLHEWTHVITWFGAGHYEDHPDEFGLQWGKIYRIWDEWNYGREEREDE